VNKWEYLVLDRWKRKFETGSLESGALMTRFVWYWEGSDGSVRATLQQSLNQLGEEGWELVSIVPMALERGQGSAGVTTNIQVTLKRQKQDS
jgi:hypothetical protein